MNLLQVRLGQIPIDPIIRLTYDHLYSIGVRVTKNSASEEGPRVKEGKVTYAELGLRYSGMGTAHMGGSYY